MSRDRTSNCGDVYDLPYFSARNQNRDRPALWFYERLVRRWIKPGALLDYGCGTGYFLRRLARHYLVSGYDLSSQARQATLRNVPGVDIYGNSCDIPAHSFSGIVSLHVLEHVSRAELPDVLACWKRILRPGGRGVCVVPDLGGRGHLLAGNRWNGFGDPTHVSLMGHTEWQALFIAAGFRVVSVGTDGLWCLPYRLGKSRLADGLRFAVPTVVQYALGRLVLPPGSGESAIFLLENRR